MLGIERERMDQDVGKDAYERGKANGLLEAWDKFCPKCEDRWSGDDNPYQHFCFGLHAPGSDAPEPSFATCPLLKGDTK